MDLHLAVIVLAAGKGTRMKDPHRAKVMYPINGKPMIEYVVNLASALNASTTIVIVGWQKDSVIEHLRQVAESVVCVEQFPQLGTGHAVMQAEAELKDFAGDVLVLSGDVPMLSLSTARELVDVHRSMSADTTVLTADLQDPTGYGRVLRNAGGSVVGVVEHKDATEDQRRISEFNSGIYVFNKSRLFEGLKHITPTNAQREYYLTDVLGYFWRQNWSVRAVKIKHSLEILGINTLEQLEQVRAAMSERDELNISPPSRASSKSRRGTRGGRT